MTDTSEYIIDLTGRFRPALAADWEQFLIAERHLFYSFPCIRKIRQYYTYNNIDYNAAVLSNKNYVRIYTALTYAFFCILCKRQAA